MTDPTDVHHVPPVPPGDDDEPDPYRGRHRATLAEAVRRAWMQRNWRKLAEYVAAGVVLVGALAVTVGWGWGYAFAGSATPTSPTGLSAAEPAPTEPSSTEPSSTGHADAAVTPAHPINILERAYLHELQFAGVKLTPGEQDIAVEIAREHVAHGHLVGMRLRITDDFFYRIPRLSTQERDIARVCVEHHFQTVTGRKQ